LALAFSSRWLRHVASWPRPAPGSGRPGISA
jgi:hypothetical protein